MSDTNTIFVKYYPEKRLKGSSKPISFDGVKFTKGRNEVPAKVKKNKYFMADVEKGIFVIEESQPERSPQETDITQLTIAEAEPIIEAETKVAVLNKWLDSDGRTGIKELIQRQIKFLESK